MSTVWIFQSPKLSQRPYVKNRRFYGNVAPHIRGRVFSLGPSTVRGLTQWGMEVVNTHTGAVLAEDRCTRYEAVVDVCDEVTAAARAAWFWDFRRRDAK